MSSKKAALQWHALTSLAATNHEAGIILDIILCLSIHSLICF